MKEKVLIKRRDGDHHVKISQIGDGQMYLSVSTGGTCWSSLSLDCKLMDLIASAVRGYYVDEK